MDATAVCEDPMGTRFAKSNSVPNHRELLETVTMMGDPSERVAELLERGADPLNQDNFLEETALMRAAFKGNTDCVDLLIPISDLEAKNARGRTALHCAVEGKCDWIVETLINHCDIETRDKDGITPLMLAAKMDDRDSARVLMNKADIHARDKDGNTALHIAARFGRMDAAEQLMERCDLNLRNAKGQSAKDLAEKSGNHDVAARIEVRMLSQNESRMIAESIGERAQIIGQQSAPKKLRI